MEIRISPGFSGKRALRFCKRFERLFPRPQPYPAHSNRIWQWRMADLEAPIPKTSMLSNITDHFSCHGITEQHHRSLLVSWHHPSWADFVARTRWASSDPLSGHLLPPTSNEDCA